MRPTLPSRDAGRPPFRLRLLTGVLHLIQPIARLFGRIEYGLTPWRHRGRGVALPFPLVKSVWREEWQSLDARVQALAGSLKQQDAAWSPGGDFDDWDFEVRGGLLASSRLLSTVEEHGGGRQMVRFRAWTRLSAFTFVAFVGFGALAGAAALSGAWPAAVALGLIASLIALRVIWEGALAMGVLTSAIEQYREASE